MAAAAFRTSRTVAATLIVGVFFTVEFALQQLANGHSIDVQNDIVGEALYWTTWAVIAPAVIALLDRCPLERPLYRPLAAHAATSMLLASAQTLLVFGVQPPHSRGVIVWGWFMGVFFYWVVAGVYTALRFHGLYAAERVSAAGLARRGVALEAELAQAKLEALRSQLRPHFLFNTLNAISVLAGEDAEKTQRMLLRLASLLRRSLDETAHEISLEQELGFLNDYLDIQRVRFGDALAVHFAVEPDALRARVPVFLLQPLVENALEHGAPGRRRTRIALEARRSGDLLHVAVADDGRGWRGRVPEHEGIGLSNTRARLQHLYGASGRIELRREPDANGRLGTRVDVWLPFVPLSVTSV